MGTQALLNFIVNFTNFIIVNFNFVIIIIINLSFINSNFINFMIIVNFINFNFIFMIIMNLSINLIILSLMIEYFSFMLMINSDSNFMNFFIVNLIYSIIHCYFIKNHNSIINLNFMLDFIKNLKLINFI